MNDISFPRSATRVSAEGGLTAIRVTADVAAGNVYLHGAHVTAFQPAGAAPVLWMSRQSNFRPDKPIRGGVPICFPWFGPHATDPKKPQHGFARTSEWAVESAETMAGGAIRVALALKSDERTKALWPHDFVARQVVTFGRELTMEFSVTNTGGAPARFEAALHSYFVVGDVRQVRVEGLEGASYHDRLKPGGLFTQDRRPVTFAAETDRTYVNTDATVRVVDPGLGRTIRVAKRGSLSTVVWNPWTDKAKAMADFGDDEWPGMLCIETANAAENAVTLAAGATHTMSVTIGVE